MTLILFPLLASEVAAQSSNAYNTVSLANEPINGSIPFREELSEAARISGAVFAGFQVERSDTGEIDLRAHIPTDWRGQKICIRVVSADGLYEAVNNYQISDTFNKDREDGLPEIIPFDTKYEEFLSKAPSGSLAIKATLGSCEAGQSPDATVGLWNEKFSGSVSLLVNSFRASKVFVYIGEASQPPVLCDPIDNQARIAFDTVCNITNLTPGDRVKLSVYRVRDNNSFSEDSVHLAIPRTQVN